MASSKNELSFGDKVFIKFDDRKEYRLGIYLRGLTIAEMAVHYICYLNKCGKWSVREVIYGDVRRVKEEEMEMVDKIMGLAQSGDISNKKLYTTLAKTFSNFNARQKNIFDQ